MYDLLQKGTIHETSYRLKSTNFQWGFHKVVLGKYVPIHSGQRIFS
jgi:hypothetical protein